MSDDDALHEIAKLVLSLPEPYRGWLIALAGIAVSFAILVNGGKAIAMRFGWQPDPNPPQWKRFVYATLDAVALNGKPFMTLIRLQKQDKAIAAQTQQLVSKNFELAQKDEVIARKTGQLHKALNLPRELKRMPGLNEDEEDR